MYKLRRFQHSLIYSCLQVTYSCKRKFEFLLIFASLCRNWKRLHNIYSWLINNICISKSCSSSTCPFFKCVRCSNKPDWSPVVLFVGLAPLRRPDLFSFHTMRGWSFKSNIFLLPQEQKPRKLLTSLLCINRRLYLTCTSKQCKRRIFRM